ncbi:hypothetical protein JOQ06_003401, partial [Pogonophryne albipinna]
MDVESLYTNIDTAKGLEAVKNILTQHPDPSRSDQDILKLLHLSLTKNDFAFDDKTYLQIKGTAMGKKFAPAYANIYMANWEQTVLPTCPKSPECYFRFLDDIWGIWTHTMEDFKTFTDLLNSHHPSIKITSETNAKEINFLDVITFKDIDFETTGCLSSKVYFKPTDSHSLLHQESFHPKHTFSVMGRTIKQNFQEIMGDQFANQPTKVISAFKRNPNLKDLLVRAKLPSVGTSVHRPQGLKTVTNPKSKKTYTLQQGITLNHANCVYLIKCQQCGILYVGETRNALKTRLSHH